MRDIPYAKHICTLEDVDEVLNVLNSDYLTQGPTVNAFESQLIESVTCQYAIAVSSATAALHIAALSLSLTHSDIVWTVGNTFAATANSFKQTGAEIVFLDINISTFNIDLDGLALSLEEAERSGVLPSVLVVVHFAGNPCAMAQIYSLSKQYSFRIIEDASHAIGASYSCGALVGSCKYSDATVFSFHPAKIVTSGEGGAFTTNDGELAERARLLRSHGITKDSTNFEKSNPEPWYYEQKTLGLNYRMSDIHAALGFSQLKKLGTFVEKRNSWASRYKKELGDLQIEFQEVSSTALSSYHLFTILLSDSANRLSLYNFLREKRIFCQVHYIPVYKFPFWQKANGERDTKPLPNTENYYERTLSLPMYPSLSERDFTRITSQIRNFFKFVI